MDIFDILSKRILQKKTKVGCSSVTTPVEGVEAENRFLYKMSNNALNLYEKKCDIKNFTKLVLSNPENTSHNEIVKELFKDNVLDPLEDEIIKNLADNKELLKDLGFDL